MKQKDLERCKVLKLLGAYILNEFSHLNPEGRS